MIANRDQPMLQGFDRFTARIEKRYGEVRDCLVAGRFEEAHILLADIAQTHARTALSLRSSMIRNGRLEVRK